MSVKFDAHTLNVSTGTPVARDEVASKPFVITISNPPAQWPTKNTYAIYSTDKTGAEILAAINASKQIVFDAGRFCVNAQYVEHYSQGGGITYEVYATASRITPKTAGGFLVSTMSIVAWGIGNNSNTISAMIAAAEATGDA